MAIRPLTIPPELFAEREDNLVTLPVIRLALIPFASIMWGQKSPPFLPPVRIDRNDPQTIGTAAPPQKPTARSET